MKTKFKLGKGVNQYKRTYYKEFGALITILFVLFIWFLTSLSKRDMVYVREEVIEAVTATTTSSTIEIEEETKEITIEEKIKQYFPRSYPTMIAIAHAESGMNHKAVGYNCYYNHDETIVYEERVKGSHSRACKKGHEKYAWSVDCGVLQRNVKGKECPEVSLDEHLKEVSELSKVQGLEAWWAYKNGSYKKFLTQK